MEEKGERGGRREEREEREKTRKERDEGSGRKARARNSPAFSSKAGQLPGSPAPPIPGAGPGRSAAPTGGQARSSSRGLPGARGHARD